MKPTTNKNQHLERHTLPQRLWRVFLVPIINYCIPEKTLRRAVAGLSEAGEAAISRKGSTHAMESMYKGVQAKKSVRERVKEYISHQLLSATKGTRNRLRVVEDALYDELVHREQAHQETRAVSLGGGICRSFMNVLDRRLVEGVRSNVSITNIDMDSTAHERGRGIAKEKGHDSMFTWVTDNALSVQNSISDASVDVVEVIGLLDYLDESTARAVLAAAHAVMKPGALLVAANVRPNVEQPFYRKIGWPPMYYRTPAELGRLLQEAGFAADSIELCLEPVQLHTIALARK